MTPIIYIMHQLEHISKLSKSVDKASNESSREYLKSTDPIVLDPSKAGCEKALLDVIQSMNNRLSNLENKMKEITNLCNKIYSLLNK